MHAIAQTICAATVALISLGLAAASAGELPAVSGPNGKLAVEGGGSSDEGEGVATGSFALPVGATPTAFRRTARSARSTMSCSAVLVCTYSRAIPRATCSVSTAAITPGIGSTSGAALEGELYIGPITLEGIAGYESLDVPSFNNGQAVISLDDNHLFGQADVGYYITDDFKIYAGYRYINETSFGAAGTE